MDMVRGHVLCCGGTGCTSSGSEAIIAEMEKQLKEFGLDKEIKVIKTGCFGLCALGPIMVGYSYNIKLFYNAHIDYVVRRHIIIAAR